MRTTRGLRQRAARHEAGPSIVLLFAAMAACQAAGTGARAQERPASLNDAIITVLEGSGSAGPQAPPGIASPTPAPPGTAGRVPAVTGQISFSPILTAGTQPAWGQTAGPVDYTSNSRISIDYVGTRVNLTLSRPSTFTRVGQPDRYYTAELIRGRQAIRVGDVTPRFSEHTSGYVRVHGVEAQLSLGRLAQLRAVHGLSQRASNTVGSAYGTYERTFTGARFTLTPWRPLALNVTAVRMTDEPSGLVLPTSPLVAARPGENLVFGGDLSLHFLARRRAQLSVEYAASVYTDDLAAPDSVGRIRGEGLSPAGIARTGLVGSLIAVNDSTRVGHAVTARLALPTGAGRTTLEFRHSSPLFATLAQTMMQSGLTRYRLQSSVPLHDRRVLVTANADYARNGPGRVTPFSVAALNAYASVAFNSTPIGRLTVGLRGMRRQNDAPAPEPQRPERRMRADMLTPTVAVSRDIQVRVPLTVTLTLTGTSYADAYRPTSAYRTLGAQLAGVTRGEGRLHLDTQARYTRTVRLGTGAVQNSAEVLLREGYDLRPGRLHVFVVQGLAGDRSSDGWQHTNLFTYGAGARWTPAETTGIELEWLSRSAINYLYDAYSYDQHTVEMRLTHRW